MKCTMMLLTTLFVMAYLEISNGRSTVAPENKCSRNSRDTLLAILSACYETFGITFKKEVDEGKTDREALRKQLESLNGTIAALQQQLAGEIAAREELKQQLVDEVQKIKQQVNNNTGNSGQSSSWVDCKHILESGYSKGSGVYEVYNPRDSGTKKVYCDMDNNGGGWMTIQRHVDGSVNFDRNWNDYRNGFGHLEGNLWLGNEFVHHLTMYKRHCLRVELENWENETRYALYDTFSVGPNAEKFKLTVSGYSGTAGDCLTEKHSGMMFTTHDQDNNKYDHANCAEYCPGGGGWWFWRCEKGFLNGRYVSENPDQVHNCEGLSWFSFGGDNYSLKRSEMKIRPYF